MSTSDDFKSNLNSIATSYYINNLFDKVYLFSKCAIYIWKIINNNILNIHTFIFKPKEILKQLHFLLNLLFLFSKDHIIFYIQVMNFSCPNIYCNQVLYPFQNHQYVTARVTKHFAAAAIATSIYQ